MAKNWGEFWQKYKNCVQTIGQYFEKGLNLHKLPVNNLWHKYFTNLEKHIFNLKKNEQNYGKFDKILEKNVKKALQNI